MKSTTRAGAVAAVAAICALVPSAADAAVTGARPAADQIVITGDAANDTLSITPVDAAGKLSHGGALPGADSATDWDTAVAGSQEVATNAAHTITVNGGAGDDRLSVLGAMTGQTSLAMSGEAGNDDLTGSSRVDALNGGDGDDRITGAQGGDAMAGGNGNDTNVWNDGDGSDTMDGEAGADTTEVNGRLNDGDQFTTTPGPDPARVEFKRINLGTFTLNIGTTERLDVRGHAGNDGFVASGAPAILIKVDGGAGDDALTGGDGPDLLNGGDGADALVGGGGDDRLVGDRGSDTMAGGAGDDTLQWNNGDGSDKMDGEAGRDTVEVNGAPLQGDQFTVVPNAGRAKFDRVNLVPFTLDIGTAEALDLNTLGGDDTVSITADTPLVADIDGGSGNDRFTADDKIVEFLHGGSGVDAAKVDTTDVTSEIENVTRADGAAIAPSVKSVVSVQRNGRLALKLTCSKSETRCAGRVTLRKSKKRIATSTYRLARGQSKTLSLKPARGYQRLARNGKIAATLDYTSADAAGNRTERTKRVSIVLPR